MGEFRPLEPQQLAQQLQLADLGSDLAASAERAQFAAAYGKTEPGKIKEAVLSSDAETGWVYCVRHGHARAIDSTTGQWAEKGACEFCLQGDFSPDRIAERKREVAASEAAFRAAVRARAEALDAAERAAADTLHADAPAVPALAHERPVDAGAVESPGRVPGDAPGTRPDGMFHVEHRPGDRRPGEHPGTGEGDLAGNWLHLVGLDDGLP